MVYENNIDENVSFNKTPINIQKVVQEPNSALLHVNDYILYNPKFKKYQCTVSISLTILVPVVPVSLGLSIDL